MANQKVLFFLIFFMSLQTSTILGPEPKWKTRFSASYALSIISRPLSTLTMSYRTIFYRDHDMKKDPAMDIFNKSRLTRPRTRRPNSPS